MPATLSRAPLAKPVTDLDWREALNTVLREPWRMTLAFQPIVDLQRGVVTGYEALARFESTPPASPGEWFAAAERFGMTAQLEAIAIANALGAREHLTQNCFLSLNVSPTALLAREIQGVFSRQGDLSGLVIELTEEAAVTDYDALNAAIAPLRAAGAYIAVDDTGAGFASLRHVTALRPDFVKIDRQLVSGVDKDEAKAAAIEMLGIFASRVDAWVIAEGIEHGEELQRLMELDIPLGQGYGLARPGLDMSERLEDAAAHLSATLRAQKAREGVGALATSCGTAPSDGPRSDVAEQFMRNPRLDVVAVTDQHGRPVSLHERPSFLRGTPARPVSLTVSPGDGVAEVARRAMTRPQDRRFEPIACCDETGKLLGIVRLERLVEALAH